MALTESVQLDIAQAEAAIAALQRDIEGLSTTQTVDVDVNVDTAPFDDIARSLETAEGEAARLSSGLVTAEQAAVQLDDSAEGVARQLSRSEDEARKFTAEMGRATRETQNTDQAMDRVASTVGRVRLAILGAVAALGARGLVRGATQAIESYNLLAESVNAVNVVFEDGAGVVFEFGEQVARSAGLARGEFQQAVIPIGALLRNFGFEARQAGTAAVDLTQRAADMASVFNTDVSTALNAINSALQGQGRPILQYGIDVSAAAVAAGALRDGLIESTDELVGATLAQARLNEIMRQSARVAGDFARTAEDPANAARVLAAEAENARAALGEALIPAYRALLQAGTDLIPVMAELAPLIGEVAGQIGSLVSAIVELEIADARITDLGRGFGQIGDAIAFAVGAVEGFGAAGRLATGDFAGALNDVTDGVDRVDRALERTAERIEFQGLITDLRNGANAVDAVGVRIIQLGRDGRVSAEQLTESFRRFASQANLSTDDTITVLSRLVAAGVGLNLTAEQVAALRVELFLLRDANAAVDAEAFRFAQILERSADAASSLVPSVRAGAVSLAELQRAANEAGVSVAEAFRSIGSAEGDLFAEGTLFDRLAVAEAEVSGFRDRVNQIGREIDPLKGAVEQLEISQSEFVANLTAAFEQNVGFEANLARLANRGFDALAARLRELGPGAASLAEQFLENIADARAAEDILNSSANQFVQDYHDALRREFRASPFTALPDDVARSLSGLSPAVAAALADEFNTTTAFTAMLTQGEAAGQFTQAGQDIGENVAQSFADKVSELAPGVGFDAALDIARALTTGEAAQAATQAGIDWAALFSSAVAANISFDFQTPQFPTGGGTGAPNTGTFSGGGSTFEVNINNPTVTDLPTALTQAEQAAQTITTLVGPY